ncbi:hypothetical protein RU97_GL000877 [Enterococcus canis]|uniref:Uncharacterized protein n=1 Tax=Enterococcus canis TaxID=214095 RepID=A0A1L8RHR8_9ENTE|nr:hypothetical protein [Enterococcus canis]OJG19306.1 hypothetical protein RU97_GL000877 [Enterococcus canis]
MDLWTKFKERVLFYWDQTVTTVLTYKKQSVIGGLVVIIALFVIAFFIPSVQANIRRSQIDALVTKPSSEKIVYFDYDEGDQKIRSAKGVSVIFVQPNGENYDELIKVLSNDKKLAELNRPIYIYPILYRKDDIVQKYKLEQPITAIFFENGKEENRFETADTSKLADELIPELNRLPMANIKELQEEAKDGK